MSAEKFRPEAEEILAARRRLEGVLRETPLLPSLFRPGCSFKAESLQVTGSFKIRAALNQIALLSDEERAAGVITSSSGNFAQAAAYAARQLGVSAKIVMMKSSNPLKVARTREYGGEVVFCEDRFEARAEKVQEIQAKEKRTPIHPYDHPNAIAGNATLGLEIIEQWPEVENIVVPISGGGLISGVALGAKMQRREVRIWGVQPEGSNATCLSFRARRLVSIERAETIADGLTVTCPGSVTFPIIQSLVEDVVTVDEDAILEAVRWFLDREHLVVEPSGAVPLAALEAGKVPREQTVLVISGGNIRPEIMTRAIESRRA